jgi:hypothetical protein
MPALTLILTLTCTLSGLVSGPAAADSTDGAPPAAGVYAVQGGTAIGEDTYRAALHPVSFSLSEGKIRLDYACLPYGIGSYSAGRDSKWVFSQGTLSTKGCPTDVAALAAEALVTLARATTWRYVSEAGSTPGEFVVVGPGGTLRLAPCQARTNQAEPPDDPSTSTGLRGEWRVEAIERTETSRVRATGPYSWTMTFDEQSAKFPDGSASGYAATPSGAFVFAAYNGPATLSFTPGPANEWQDLRTALALTNRYSQQNSGTAVFTGPGVRVALARPAATNRAFSVKAITPSSSTLRVAVGQSAKVAVQAEPAAPRATGKAMLTWKNSKIGIVGVSAGAGKPSAKKTGVLTVPMNAAETVRLKVAGIKKGKAVIKLTAQSGAKASIKVKVVRKRVAAERVVITKGQADWRTLPDGRVVLDLGTRIRPASATVGAVGWSSSAPSLARVDPSGRVTLAAKGNSRGGKVTITARVGKAKDTISLKLPQKGSS